MSSEIKKNKVGRPSKFESIDFKQVEILCLKGFTDQEMADFFGVCRATWANWKKDNKNFLDTIKIPKDIANKKVEASLYERACGYSHPDVHISNYMGEITVTQFIKHYPPDTAAAFIWLKNRDPKRWRDKHEIDLTSDININVTIEGLENGE